MLSYILQIITICITLGLGLYSAWQTRKIEHGQNIISVTTNYRLKRSEQLKEYAQVLLTNTNPQLLDFSENNYEALKGAIAACEGISAILHRHFDADEELIDLSSNIVSLAIEYLNSGDKRQLEKKRQLFRIKCDLYTTADWQRIKRETKGVNTSSESWIEYYNKLSEKYADEIEQLKL